MKSLYFYLFSLIFLLAKTSVADNIDSLMKQYKYENSTQKKTKLELDIGFYYLKKDPNLAIKYLNLAYNNALKFNLKEEEIVANKYLGIWNRFTDNYEKARQFLNSALNLSRKHGNKELIADVYQDLANLYRRTGAYDSAIICLQNASRFYESINDSVSSINVAISMGNVYVDMEQFDLSEKFYKRAYEKAKVSDNKSYMCSSLIGLAILDGTKGNTILAIEKLKTAYEIAKKNDEYNLMGTALANIMQASLYAGNYEAAIEAGKETISLKRKLNNNMDLCDAYASLANSYAANKNFEFSHLYLDSAFVLANKINSKYNLQYVYQTGAAIYGNQGNFKKAFEFQKKYIELSKELNKEQKLNQIQELEAKYENEKKEKENQLLQAKNQLSQKTIEQQKTTTAFILLGFALLLIFTFFIFSGLRKQRKANKIIELQKLEVETQKNLVDQKQKEILDSIHYAKRIQQALLPSNAFLDKKLK